VKFHDGSDFTCADAKYSLDKLADPNRAHWTFVAIIEKVFDGTTCTDDFTLVLPLKEPSAAIFTMLAGAHLRSSSRHRFTSTGNFIPRRIDAVD
jgi:ABC-type transport system substrate-binding protein